MEPQRKVLFVLVAAMAGGSLALVGAPTLPVVLLVPPLVGTGLEPAERTPVFAPAPGPATAPSLLAPARIDVGPLPASGPDVPAAVAVCWSPTARRLLGPKVHAQLSARGARVEMHLESNLGAASRIGRGLDDLALVAGAETPAEPPRGIVSRTLGYHVLVPIVHADNGLAGLSSALLLDALGGAASDWSHLGRTRAGAVALVAVEEGPFSDQAGALAMLGQRLAPHALLLGDDDAVAAHVASRQDALGLCSLAAARRGRVKVLAVDSVLPDVGAHLAGRYPFATPVRVLVRDARRLAWLDTAALSAGLMPLPAAPR